MGCGPGQFAELLRYQGITRYVGFDYSHAAIAIARKRLPEVDFRVDDARISKLYSSVPHDIVICTEVLEHIEEDLQVLSAFRPGVRVIATVPSYDSHSHVRFFKNTDEVLTRYRASFERVEVHAFELDTKSRFYLLDGLRGG